ncbi:hypothetical protein PMJ10TS2_72870 [Paenibacillus melissococcoides]
MKAYGITDKRVWVADSFEGLPPPDVEKYPVDAGLELHTVDYLKVSMEEVALNFQKYDLLDVRGGYIIIDDYAISCCAAAVHDFRNLHQIQDPLIQIDYYGAYWRKSK